MNRRSVLASFLVLTFSLCIGPASAQNDAATMGQWQLGPLFDVAPINMLVLSNGKVMFYPGAQISGDDARVWDPATGTVTSLAKAGFDIFCSGMAFLWDGEILIAGGNVDASTFTGLPNASIYNPTTNSWWRVPDMNAARWYPTLTTLAGFQGQYGDVLVLSGWIDNVQLENPLPQVYQVGPGTWRSLTNAVLRIFSYPWAFVTPFGNVIVAGPEQTTRYLDTAGAGAWTTVAMQNFAGTRDYGSAVMWDEWRIMVVGGSQPPTNTAEVLNLADPNPTWQYTGSMAFPRRMHNATILPDRTVLVTGGTSGPGFNDTTSPVYPAELWDPWSGTWSTKASQTIGRFYHSGAVLLPDARVLVAGGDFTFQSEIYSPPYLFRGPQPTITSAPSQVTYGQTFFVGTPDPTNVKLATWIRLPAATHAFNESQRMNNLNYTPTTGGLNVTAPSSELRAPPGYYMLFILNENWVPSIAKIIRIGYS
ncbi:MAG: hypothetical protein OJF52_001970 [Nitrospira sp.]|nr:MAG: hypothetical protein OJF52_001970 [Nitrospira sp.]